VDLAPRVRRQRRGSGRCSAGKGKEDAGTDHLARTNPLGRVGTAEEVTDAILFLLAKRFITGLVVFVDGYRISGKFLWIENGLAALVRELLTELGEDPDREGLSRPRTGTRKHGSSSPAGTP
jgi:hypothetical protein